jgi:hypothetical protein
VRAEVLRIIKVASLVICEPLHAHPVAPKPAIVECLTIQGIRKEPKRARLRNMPEFVRDNPAFFFD